MKHGHGYFLTAGESAHIAFMVLPAVRFEMTVGANTEVLASRGCSEVEIRNQCRRNRGYASIESIAVQMESVQVLLDEIASEVYVPRS